MPTEDWRYLIALGGNMPHHRHGAPAGVLRAGVAALTGLGLEVERVAPIIATAPLGPSRRRFANGAVVCRSALAPPDLLVMLQRVERGFGRRRGRRWGARVLDLDIVLWSGGVWHSPGLTVPHLAFRGRSFVLRPAAAIAPGWRDPLTGLTMRQLAARLAPRKSLSLPRGPSPGPAFR